MINVDVSIIIVTYNTRELTSNCIDSIFEKSSGFSFEVILVDNASTDGSKELFEKDNRIKYIYSNVNLGFGRANNLGYEHSKGEYLFFLNSDTYLMNNAIYLLWKRLKKEYIDKEEVACAGAMLLDKDGKIAHSYARFPSKIKSILDASVYVILWKLHLMKSIPWSNNYGYNSNLKKEVFDVDYITGADLMVKTEFAAAYGLFDPDFFMYCEESEMQYRYMKKGLRRIIVSGPEIVHLEGKSNSAYSPSRVTMVMKSQFLYFKKTNGKLSYILYSICYKIAYELTYLICFPFVHGNNKEKWAHFKAVIKM